MTIRDILTSIRERLQKAGIEDFEYESWVLLEWKLHIDRAEFYMNPNREVKQELLEELEEVLLKREQRVPLQYLMGECEFMGFDFSVDERVLIPRQDTECLVELAVEDIRNVKTQNRCEFNNAADQKNEQKVKVLDLCTGSGCIGIATLAERPDTRALGVDLSQGALEIASENAVRNGVSDRFRLLRADLLTAAPGELGRFDAILSNPPYIRSDVVDTLSAEVRHEPRMALDGGADGLVFYRALLRLAETSLNDGGFCLFEIGYDQGEEIRALAASHGFACEVKRDLGGQDRVAVLTRGA